MPDSIRKNGARDGTRTRGLRRDRAKNLISFQGCVTETTRREACPDVGSITAFETRSSGGVPRVFWPQNVPAKQFVPLAGRVCGEVR
jgi:hypothetical protein